MNVINFTQPITGNFIVDTIMWLVTATGSVAVGVILFTVLLKVITLPFDIMSRRSMRKNSLLMEQMRPELERLQKQYANNKELYNQKMMALYKKNGYSMWGSCLPTILTLVIFIVAINGFTGYSQYQNRVYFYEMSSSFNAVIYEGFEKDGDFIKVDEEGNMVIADATLYSKLDGSEKIVLPSHVIYSIQKHEDRGVTVHTQNGFIKYSVSYDSFTGEKIEEKYELIPENLFTEKNFNQNNDKIFIGFELDDTYIVKNSVEKTFTINDKAIYDLVMADADKDVTITAGDHKIFASISSRTLKVSTENGYLGYQTDFVTDGGEVVFETNKRYNVIKDKMLNDVACAKESGDIRFGMEVDSQYIKVLSNGQIEIDIDALNSATTLTEKGTTESGKEFDIFYSKTDKGYTLFTENGYMQYFREVTTAEETSFNAVTYGVIADKLEGESALVSEINNNLKNEQGKTYAEALEESKSSEKTLTPEEFIKDIQGVKSAEAFRNDIDSFLWVKNIWVADGAHKHPVLEYEEFKTTVADTSGCACSCNKETSVPLDEEEYNVLTSKLTKEKTQANGFYILCIMSALISLASQIIMNKSQKAQLELQTVDGQGASNQKMMTWMMPIMMAFFSFMYTSAFSIYIIINTALSILTTFVINKLVDINFQKANKTSGVVRGRVYVQKEVKEDNKKDKKVKKGDKKEDTTNDNGGDFLTGLADGKRPTKKAKKKK